MVWGRPSSDSRKSSLARSRTISPFLPYTLASRLTTLTSVEKVTSCQARAREAEASRPAAERIRRRRVGRATADSAGGLGGGGWVTGFGLEGGRRVGRATADSADGLGVDGWLTGFA